MQSNPPQQNYGHVVRVNYFGLRFSTPSFPAIFYLGRAGGRAQAAEGASSAAGPESPSGAPD